jgi:hypothetical protein
MEAKGASKDRTCFERKRLSTLDVKAIHLTLEVKTFLGNLYA